MNDPRWKKLLPVDSCAPGAVKYVELEGRELAVFHLSKPDRFVVTANACPHAGGNLAAGEVQEAVVTCPWHHWQFDLDTGRCTLSESVHLSRFETRVEGGFIFARLDQPIPPDSQTGAGSP